ncbi:MAG: TIR domain-containing protein [bacterium]
MEKKIFISYSSKDVTIANQLVEYLEANGCVCWIAPRNITSGHDYTDMINDAIKECNALVMIMSEHSVKSQWVKKELSTAVSYNKTIIPFKIKDVTLSGGLLFMLNNVQWIDATSNAPKMFPQVISGLGVGGVAPAVAPDDNKPSGGSKKTLWIVLAAVAVAAIVGVLLLLPGDKSEPIAPQATPDTVIEKIIDTVIVEKQSKTVKNAKETAADKRAETTKAKDKEKQDVKAEATTQTVEEVKSETKQETSATVTKEETPAPKTTVVMPEEQSTASVDPAPQTSKSSTSPKMRKAKRLWGDKNYKEALKLFQELKKADPNNPEIDRFISDCRSHL